MANNLLVIVSDEHQARAMGCAGHDFIETPHLDRLAASGMRFTNAYTPSPICVPARAAFATGRYVHQTGCWDNAMAYSGAHPSWGHQLQDADITVESIGKLHYRDSHDDTGFDQLHIPMMIKDGIGMIWASVRNEKERVLEPNRMLGDYIGPGDSPYTDYDAAVTKQTMAWLHEKANADEPWCLYVGLVAPHFPFVCPHAFYDLYDGMELPPRKLHPDDGFARHPWIEKLNSLMDSDAQFTDDDERYRAHIAYYALTSWLDHNVGQIVSALDAAGLSETTNIIYSSDHGDNVGTRGLWGKSNMYEESAAIPLIMTGPDIQTGICDTPVSLLDISASIPAQFGLPVPNEMVGRPLKELAAEPYDATRSVFSEYHAVGAVTGGFMLRKGRFKLIEYVDFEPELFDLEADPEELVNLAADPAHSDTYAEMRHALDKICDITAVDRQAHADQRALVDSFGGLDAVRNKGTRGATPAPKVT